MVGLPLLRPSVFCRATPVGGRFYNRPTVWIPYIHIKVEDPTVRLGNILWPNTKRLHQGDNRPALLAEVQLNKYSYNCERLIASKTAGFKLEWF